MARRPETWGERALRELLGSQARAEIIGWICREPEAPVVAARLARELDLRYSAVWHELQRLARLGMIRAGERMGRTQPYYLDPAFPLFPGLRSMVMYATGIIAVLREQFSKEQGVDVALIFGSLAAGDDRPQSDVDLLVVGDIPGRRLATLIREAEQRTRREVNQVHYSAGEFASRLREGGSFLPSVMAGPKVFIRGDADALRRLAE